MKDISITCGKAININEFLAKKHLTSSNIIVRIPTFEYKDDETVHYTGYDEIQLNGPFVIYKDNYHGKLHIAHFNDMLMSIASQYSDFEDFSQKDIEASFKTLKEAVLYMMDKCNISDKIKNEIMEGEYPEFRTGTYDHCDWFADVLTGKETDEGTINWWDDNTEWIGAMRDYINIDNWKEIEKDFKNNGE